MMYQTCGRCKEKKSITDFSPSRQGKNGYPCRSCVRQESANRKLAFGQEVSYKCGTCKEVKLVEEFSPSRRTNGGDCITCCSVNSRNRRIERGPEEELKRRVARYGITVEYYNELLLSQMGRCAICGEFQYKELHIDHDELTGKVRGLLCGNCNRGIGCLKHDTERLMSAATYLLKNQNLLLETETI